ncbi:UDP-N-acetylglucosamine 2-epimerase [Zavarzinia compransoris]|uniref:UDP-N-acetylglucosamine 2-epimerase n=1 Tax=Zavarzinia marina TaxID=2911065 RepID=UPI001F18ACE8|nr:UDP-N-acetylglucosamine 2-epimerase [Zavarzinia marina]MCF4166599.1 UDP-N-acetylglucosamine 2-epimerase [Zavarzinia marina]
MNKRRIAIVTTTRAEYGLLVPLIRALGDSDSLEPLLVISGTHLDAGGTAAEIEADGVAIAARVAMPIGEATDDEGRVAALAQGLAGFGTAFTRLRPDAVVVLGDRYEMLAVATATVAMRLPLIHLEGGHVTEGALDDAVRHALTKLAVLHFTAHPAYAARIRRMGEEAWRVHCVGSLAVDNIRAEPRLSLADLSARAGLALDGGFVLLTYHPATLAGDAASLGELDALLQALDGRPDLKVLATAPNADPGGLAVRARLDAFVAARPGRAVLVPSLGRRAYLSAVALAAAVVGNSSSGLIEAPSLGTPCLNIGERQAGRLRPAGVLDCPGEPAAVAAALARVTAPEFRGLVDRDAFGDGTAAARIRKVLEQVPFTDILRKRFQDEALGEEDPRP